MSAKYDVIQNFRFRLPRAKWTSFIFCRLNRHTVVCKADWLCYTFKKVWISNCICQASFFKYLPMTLSIFLFYLICKKLVTVFHTCCSAWQMRLVICDRFRRCAFMRKTIFATIDQSRIFIFFSRFIHCALYWLFLYWLGFYTLKLVVNTFTSIPITTSSESTLHKTCKPHKLVVLSIQPDIKYNGRKSKL